MSASKALAIVLRTVDFSETSSIVTLFTREYGKISGLAKGARRRKSPFEAALDLLAVCRVVFLHRAGDVLDLLTEAKLERRFRNRSRRLACLYAGYYVAELLADLTDEGDPHTELFDAALVTLIALDRGVPSTAFDRSQAGDDILRWAVERDAELAAATSSKHEFSLWQEVMQFEVAALRSLGHLPSLDECVECGEPIANTPRIAFGQLAGGVLCQRCKAGHRQVVSVSLGAMNVLRGFVRRAAAANGEESAAIDPRYRGELRGLLNHYIANQLGRRSRMNAFLGMLSE